MENGLRATGAILMAIALLLTAQALGYLTLPYRLVDWHVRHGPQAAWFIRGGMGLVGALFFFLPPTAER